MSQSKSVFQSEPQSSSHWVWHQPSARPLHHPTCEAAEPERPEPLFAQSVIQHSQGVAGVVQLAASYDAKVVQRQQTHRHVSYEDIALHLHDALKKRRRQNTQDESVVAIKTSGLTTQMNMKMCILVGRRGRGFHEGV